MRFFAMRNFRKRYGAYPILALLILAASVLMRTIACLYHYNPFSGYYTSSLGPASGWCVAAGALILFTYVFAANKESGLVASFTSPASYIPTGIISVALFFLSKSLLSGARGILIPNFRGETNLTTALISLVAAIAGFAAIGYFLLSAVIDKRHYLFRANFGLFAVIFLALYASLLYFDKSMPVNSPNKIADQMAFLFSAVFFLYETRISLGREKWATYTAFGFVALLLTAYASIPELIVYFATGRVLAASLLESVLTLSLFIFISARVVIAGFIPEDGEAAFITKLKSAAKMRIDERAQLFPPESATGEAESEAQKEDESAIDPGQVSFDFQESFAKDYIITNEGQEE